MAWSKSIDITVWNLVKYQLSFVPKFRKSSLIALKESGLSESFESVKNCKFYSVFRDSNGLYLIKTSTRNKYNSINCILQRRSLYLLGLRCLETTDVDRCKTCFIKIVRVSCWSCIHSGTELPASLPLFCGLESVYMLSLIHI